MQFNLLELPSSRQAQAAWQTESRFLWEGRALREALQELSAVHGLSIWIDRRIDPQQPITLATKPTDADTSLGGRLRQIAAMTSAEVGLVENVVYFGPPTTAARVQRAAVRLHDALSRGEQQGRTATLRDWQWAELSTPTELLQQLESAWKIQVEGDLPHDLMHAGQLMQPSSLATQLSLLFAGFEQEVQWLQNRQLRAQPLATTTRWQANYRTADLQLGDPSLAAYPGSKLDIRGSLATVSGVTDFHLSLLARPPARPTANTPDGQRWAFNVNNVPAEAVMTKLAKSIGFEVEWDAACTPMQREQLVRFEVNQATLDELLVAFGNAAKLQVERSGERVRISP